MNNQEEQIVPLKNGNMSAYPTIAPPDTLGAAIAPIGHLSEEQFGHFLRAVSTPRSFSLTSKQLKDLKATVPEVASSLHYVLGAFAFLYGQIDSLGEIDGKFPQVIAKLIDDLDIKSESSEQQKLLQQRLELILKKNPAHAKFRKVQRLQSGFIPNATSFRTMVDLRPDFGESDALDYRGLLKVIQLRIMTDATDPAMKEIVFQLNEEALGELRSTIDRAQKKLDLLKNQPSLSSQFIEVG